MTAIASGALSTSLLVGGATFVIATIIDHGIGLSCPDVAEIKVAGWKLFLHKLMYVAVGAGAMFVFLT